MTEITVGKSLIPKTTILGRRWGCGSIPLARLNPRAFFWTRHFVYIIFIYFIICTNELSSAVGQGACIWCKHPGFDPRRVLLYFSWQLIADSAHLLAKRPLCAHRSHPLDHLKANLTFQSWRPMVNSQNLVHTRPHERQMGLPFWAWTNSSSCLQNCFHTRPNLIFLFLISFIYFNYFYKKKKIIFLLNQKSQKH